MDAKVHFQERLRKVEVGGRCVDRVAAQDDERVDAAGPHVCDELSKRLHLVRGIGLNGLRVERRLADVAQGLIHRVCQGVHLAGLRVAGNDN